MGCVYFPLPREAHGASETHLVPTRPGPGPQSCLVSTSCGPRHRAQFSVLSLLFGVAAGSRGLTDRVLFSSLFPHPTIALLSLTLIQLPLGVSSGWLSVLLLFLLLSDPLKDLWSVSLCCCSIARSCPTLPPHGLRHATLSCPSLSSGACSCPFSPGCNLSSSSSAALFSFSPHSLPASGSIPTSWLLASGDQSTRV